MSGPPKTATSRDALLAWYRPRRRMYPWRAARADPYRVLLSEVMLQQTQMARVIPVFERFVRQFPAVASLAAATPGEILRAWSGLGYNRRAVNLSRAARAIVGEHGGRVPGDPATLRRLPGVGPYTAAAVASIAFGAPVPAVDTNVARVMARAGLGVEPHETSPEKLQAAAAAWLDPADPGAWNQALMDLGREICKPTPRCVACPLGGTCRFRAAGREGRPAARSRSSFAGSLRRVRGIIVRALRDRSSISLAELTRLTEEPGENVSKALRGLTRDGLVEASTAALMGSSRGRVRLPRA